MSEFWKRKIERYFSLLDSNKNGCLTREDFNLMADRFSEGESPDSKRRHEVKEKLSMVFDSFAMVAGKDGKITKTQLVEAMNKLRCDPEFPKMLEGLVQITFSLVDTDNDGYLQQAEYAKFFYNFRIADHERLAEIAFKALDTDQDGKLSMSEAIVGYNDYLLSEDESLLGNLMFGPLP